MKKKTMINIYMEKAFNKILLILSVAIFGAGGFYFGSRGQVVKVISLASAEKETNGIILEQANKELASTSSIPEIVKIYAPKSAIAKPVLPVADTPLEKLASAAVEQTLSVQTIAPTQFLASTSSGTAPKTAVS